MKRLQMLSVLLLILLVSACQRKNAQKSVIETVVVEKEKVVTKPSEKVVSTELPLQKCVTFESQGEVSCAKQTSQLEALCAR